jgi:pyruvate dehydrogenase E2 component (dihydrolipoamide acetyltransferase)
MPNAITMPRLSDTMEEGTLNKWKVKVGDKVKPGDELADIETDKATMALTAYDDGLVAKLVAKEGQTLKVGQLIVVLTAGKETVEEAAKYEQTGGAAAEATAKPAASASTAPSTSTAKPDAPAAASASDSAEVSVGRVKISPLAAKMAQDNGLDINKIKGTGPEGRVIKRDIEQAIAAPAPAAALTPSAPASTPAPATAPAPLVSAKLENKLIPVSQMRKTIARRLLESKTSIPHFTVTVSINTDPLLALRETLNTQLASQGVKLSVNDFIVRAAALAIVQHPFVNASWASEGVQQFGSVNIGIAVALPTEKGGGLVVPVIRDTLGKGLRTISAETKTLADKARKQGLTADEMADGTFTISNLGMLGVDHFEAIINPPQSAILAIGAAIKKPVVRNDAIVIGSEMTITMSADHRVVDGAYAAEYLKTLRQLLENPATLLV